MPRYDRASGTGVFVVEAGRLTVGLPRHTGYHPGHLWLALSDDVGAV